MKFVLALAASMLALSHSALATETSWVDEALRAPSMADASLGRVGPLPDTGEIPKATAPLILISFISNSPYYTKGEPCFSCVLPTGASKLDADSFGLNVPIPESAAKSTSVLAEGAFTDLNYKGAVTIAYGLVSTAGKALVTGKLTGTLSPGVYYLTIPVKRPVLHNTGVLFVAAVIVGGKEVSNTAQTPILLL